MYSVDPQCPYLMTGLADQPTSVDRDPEWEEVYSAQQECAELQHDVDAAYREINRLEKELENQLYQHKMYLEQLGREKLANVARYEKAEGQIVALLITFRTLANRLGVGRATTPGPCDATLTPATRLEVLAAAIKYKLDVLFPYIDETDDRLERRIEL